MDPDGTRLLGEPDHGVLHRLRRDHHQVGELVDHDEDVRERRLAALAEGAIRLVDVAGAHRREALVAALHLREAVGEDGARLLRARDDGREQVRHRLEVAELDPLRVDEDQAHVVGRRAQEDRREERVEAARLARAGRAGDEQVRHPREVGPDGGAGDVLAEPDRDRAGRRRQGLVDVAEGDEVRGEVRAARRRPPACRGSARGSGSRSWRARTRGRPSAPRPWRPSSPVRAGARSASRAGRRSGRSRSPRRRSARASARGARRRAPRSRPSRRSAPARPGGRRRRAACTRRARRSPRRRASADPRAAPAARSGAERAARRRAAARRSRRRRPGRPRRRRPAARATAPAARAAASHSRHGGCHRAGTVTAPCARRGGGRGPSGGGSPRARLP